MVTEDSIITFHKLHRSDEPDEHNLYTLTRVDTDVSKQFDKNVIALIENLSKGMTVLEAAYEIGFSTIVVLSVLAMFQEAHFLKEVKSVKITGRSTIEFYPIRISSQPDDHNLFGIVRWDTDDTLNVDSNVVSLIKYLSSGMTVKEAADKIGFSVDVALSVLKMFHESHFFKNINGVYLYDSGKKIKPLLPNTGPKWFSWTLNKPFRYFVLTIGISGVLIGLPMNGIPTYKDFFWSPDIFIVFFSLFLSNTPLLFAHEFAHFCTTKAVGGEAMIHFNYRYIYVVAETESYHLGVVSKKQRYLIYLAGASFDLFIAGVLYWFLFYIKLKGINIGLLYNFLIAVILMQLLGIIWQFNVFLETDMYNFLSEYLNMENLRSDAIKYIALQTKRWKQVLLFPVKRMLLFFLQDSAEIADDLRLLTKSERSKLRLYVIFLILGLLFVTVEFIFYTLPTDFTFIIIALRDMLLATQKSDISFIKSLTIIGIVLSDYLLLIFLKGKQLAKHGRKNLRY